MKNYAETISMKALKENECATYLCLKKNDTAQLKYLVKNGMPLSAFCLTLAVLFGYTGDAIKSFVAQSENLSKDVFLWLKSYFKLSELSDIVPKVDTKTLADTLTDDELLELKLYGVLISKKRYDLVAEHSPQTLKDFISRHLIGSGAAAKALLEYDYDTYVGFICEKEMYKVILGVHDGWKYIIDNVSVTLILRKLKYDIYADFLPKEEIVEYCLSKGFADELYEFRFNDELLEHGQFELFRKRHSFYPKFLENYPEEVDWEDLWSNALDEETPKYLLQQARKHKDVPACYNFLYNHSGWLMRLRLDIIRK